MILLIFLHSTDFHNSIIDVAYVDSASDVVYVDCISDVFYVDCISDVVYVDSISDVKNVYFLSCYSIVLYAIASLLSPMQHVQMLAVYLSRRREHR